MSSPRGRLEYFHVDVFSQTPFSGNSLPVFPDAGGMSSSQMLRITQELRHFEAIFLEPTSRPCTVRTRVFDLVEELPFAGHPIIGAAGVLHARSGAGAARSWRFDLPGRSVTVSTERTEHGYFGLLDQGRPEFLGEVEARSAIASAFGLEVRDLRSLPLEIISTGLRYLVVPVRHGALARARIVSDIADLVRGYGAQFAVLLDEAALEIRHWNNDGVLEDVATGSAAGVIGAYRLQHRLARSGETFTLKQGRFVGRPSLLRVRPQGRADDVDSVEVGGEVVVVGSGTLDVLPEEAA
jgi:PhzF family phenazine biosynthesis protein